MKSYQN